jgi:zinc protease
MISRTLSTVAFAFLLLSCSSIKNLKESPEGAIGLKEPGSPFVAFNIWIRCGSQNDPAGKEGLAAITASFLAESGTEKNSYEQIIKKLYPLAANYRAVVDKEMTNFTGRIHKDNLEAYYEIFKDAILAPAFDPEDFQRIKTRTMNYLQQARRFSNDEELVKELLFREIYRGTPYEHPEEGYVTTVRSITLDDVKSFYSKHYTRNNVTVAVGGGFPEGFKRRVRQDFDALPSGERVTVPAPEPAPIEGIHVLLVEKNTDSSPVSFGFPIDLLRSGEDFYAMMLLNSAMGEHRSAFGRLYQVIREMRGMNYGDYSYIEAYPQGYRTEVPPVNVSRRSQIFEVWLRPIAATSPGTLHDRTLFAIRAALRELAKVTDKGITLERFEQTRRFLKNYTVNFGTTLSRRLGYRVDDAFYAIPGDGFLASIRPGLDGLTVEQVNKAIRQNIQIRNLWIVVITQDADGFKSKLLSGLPIPIEYPASQPQELIEEDKEIAAFPIPIEERNIRIVGINDVFESPDP